MIFLICFVSLLISDFRYSYHVQDFSTISLKRNQFRLHETYSIENIGNELQSNVQDGLSDVGVILLAGGKGKRMKSSIPKQFLPVLGKPVFLRSLDVFQSMDSRLVTSIVIVLDESYREEYNYLLEQDKRIHWADPGVERQDSVFNGLTLIPDNCKLVAIHDAARPLVTLKEVMDCLYDGLKYGAAVLGVPMKATVKESEDGQFVLRTVPRSRLWEIHTPQVATKELFLKGFDQVRTHRLEVTDDVSVIEALNLPVKLTLGQYTNIKLTTPEDLQVAEQILIEREITQSSPLNVEITQPKPLLLESNVSFPCSSERYRESLSS